MKNILAKVAVVACLFAPLLASAESSTLSYKESLWSLSFTGVALADQDLAHETYRVTLGVDTNKYKGEGLYLDQLALKVSSSAYSATLISAPGGTSAWILEPGGLNDSGCGGKGGGFECINSGNDLSLGKGITFSGGNGAGIDFTWVFDVTVDTKVKLLTGDYGPSSVKARFVDSKGKNVDLMSKDIRLTKVTAVTAVPEPETYAMLMAGLGLLGFVARRKKRIQATA